MAPIAQIRHTNCGLRDVAVAEARPGVDAAFSVTLRPPVDAASAAIGGGGGDGPPATDECATARARS
jgi:hypothetical protein